MCRGVCCSIVEMLAARAGKNEPNTLFIHCTSGNLRIPLNCGDNGPATLFAGRTERFYQLWDLH